MLDTHRHFLDQAMPILQADLRFAGMAAGGSFITGKMDEFSDLDLILVVHPDHYAQVMQNRLPIAESLGALLAGFTGEHVGEPRLVICLYGSPLLHVDLKFVLASDLAKRVEDPVILWERDQVITEALKLGAAAFPQPDWQWIEDRFWVWVHYGATKLGRGELFELISFLDYLRTSVLGSMALVKNGHLPRGVRNLERDAPAESEIFKQTLSLHDPASCARALQATVALYQSYRDAVAIPALVQRIEAEKAAITYMHEIVDRVVSE